MRLATAVVAVVAGAVGLFYGLVPTRIERFLDHDFHPGRIEARAGAVLKAAGFAAESSPVTKLLAPENRLLAAVDAVYALEREPPPPHAPLWSYKLRWLDRDRRRIAQVRLTLDGRLIGLEVASLEGRESAGSFADPREVALHFLQRVGEPDAAQFVARAQVERAGGGAIQFLDRRRRDRLDWSRSVTVSGNRVTGYEFTLAPIGAPALEERTGYTAARNLSLGLFVIKQIFFVFAILFLLHTFRRQELSTRPGLALALMAGGANLLGLIVSSPFSFELRWQDQSLPLIGRILTSPNVALQTLVMMGLQAISLGLIVFAVATAGTHADAGGKGALTQELSSVLHRTYPSRRKLIGRIGEALAWGVGLTALTGLFAHLQPLIADATFLPQIVSSSFVLNASHPASALGSMALGDIAMDIATIFLFVLAWMRSRVHPAIAVAAVGLLYPGNFANFSSAQYAIPLDPWQGLVHPFLIGAALAGIASRAGLLQALCAGYAYLVAVNAAPLLAASGLVSHWTWAGTVVTILVPLLAALLYRRRSVQALERSTHVPAFLTDIVEGERRQRELETAAQLQTRFLPAPTFRRGSFECVAATRMARQVGGDFYTYIELPGDAMALAIGDVCGKSIPGALYMGMMVTLFESEAVEAHGAPAKLLAHLNQLLVPEMRPARMFAAAIYLEAQPDGRVRIACAGLPPPLLYHARSRTLEEIELPGAPLGAWRRSEYLEHEFQMAAGDTLVLLTDGVAEAADLEGREFGSKPLAEVVLRTAPLGTRPVVEALENALAEFTSGAPPSDDRSLLVLRRLSPTQHPFLDVA
ncbi:MAG TPA: SpoIIE family protein phosphatase [Acidobacteriota bacterium]